MIALLLTALAFADIERIAVLDFDASFEDEWVGILSDQVRAGALSELDPLDYSVITRENMMQFLDDMGKDISCLEGSCEVAIARNIGADFVISGAVSQVEGIYIINMKLHNSYSGQLLGLKKVQGSEPLQLIEDIQEVTEEMVSILEPEASSEDKEGKRDRKKENYQKPTDLEFLIRNLDTRSMYIDLMTGTVKHTQDKDTAKIVFSEFRIDQNAVREDDRFILPLNNSKIYFIGYIEDIPSKFTRSYLPMGIQNGMKTTTFFSRKMMNQYISASTHDISGSISLNGDIEDLYLQGFNFKGRYRVQTGFLEHSSDTDFQKINQYFIVDENSKLLRPKDIEQLNSNLQ
jgi:TolB-like protein